MLRLNLLSAHHPSHLCESMDVEIIVSLLQVLLFVWDVTNLIHSNTRVCLLGGDLAELSAPPPLFLEKQTQSGSSTFSDRGRGSKDGTTAAVTRGRELYKVVEQWGLKDTASGGGDGVMDRLKEI